MICDRGENQNFWLSGTVRKEQCKIEFKCDADIRRERRTRFVSSNVYTFSPVASVVFVADEDSIT